MSPVVTTTSSVVKSWPGQIVTLRSDQVVKSSSGQMIRWLSESPRRGVSGVSRRPPPATRTCTGDNNCLAEMWSGANEGSYSKLIHCCITQLYARKQSIRRRRPGVGHMEVAHPNGASVNLCLPFRGECDESTAARRRILTNPGMFCTRTVAFRAEFSAKPRRSCTGKRCNCSHAAALEPEDCLRANKRTQLLLTALRSGALLVKERSFFLCFKEASLCKGKCLHDEEAEKEGLDHLSGVELDRIDHRLGPL